jgi:hypothetical protein
VVGFETGSSYCGGYSNALARTIQRCQALEIAAFSRLNVA